MPYVILDQKKYDEFWKKRKVGIKEYFDYVIASGSPLITYKNGLNDYEFRERYGVFRQTISKTSADLQGLKIIKYIPPPKPEIKSEIIKRKLRGEIRRKLKILNEIELKQILSQFQKKDE